MVIKVVFKSKVTYSWSFIKPFPKTQIYVHQQLVNFISLCEIWIIFEVAICKPIKEMGEVHIKL